MCPTCKYDCSVYKCSRLHTYCELYSKYNDDNEDVFMFHDYYLHKPVPVSPKSRKLHPREIIKQRCGLVHFDFDAKIQNTRLTIKNEVYLLVLQQKNKNTCCLQVQISVKLKILMNIENLLKKSTSLYVPMDYKQTHFKNNM